MKKFDRITSDPAILGGQPTIRGMRLTVRRVVEALALYPNWDDLRAEYPELEAADIRQAVQAGLCRRRNSPAARGKAPAADGRLPSAACA